MMILRKRYLKDSLDKTEGRLRTLIQTIPDLIWLKDQDGVYLTCNRMFERFFGAKESDIVGKTDYDFVNRELADFFRENDRRAMEAGKPTSNEEWITFADDGHRALLDTIKTPMYDSKGNLIGVLGIGRDITRYRQAEDEIREREVQYRNLADSGLALIWGSGIDKLCNYFNEPWLKFRGRTLEQEFGEGWKEGVHPDDLQHCLDIYESSFDKRIKFEVDYRLRNSRGEYRWVKDLGTPNFDSKGDFIGYIGHCFDITDQKNVERDLIRAKEEAESADRLKTAFLATMSHEIRTPLNSIIGFSGILLLEKAGLINEEQKKQLEMIKASGRHLLNLINDILDISKIEAGEFTLNMESINMNDLLEEIFNLEAPCARSKGLRVTLERDSHSVVILSDRQRIRQVLINVFNNAIKFTEKGSIHMRCYTEDGFAKIEVSDTGIGIERENLDRIFNPFTRVENYLVKKSEGSGLGLSVSKKLIELLHGTIKVKSEYGAGSTFIISLPVE